MRAGAELVIVVGFVFAIKSTAGGLSRLLDRRGFGKLIARRFRWGLLLMLLLLLRGRNCSVPRTANVKTKTTMGFRQQVSDEG